MPNMSHTSRSGQPAPSGHPAPVGTVPPFVDPDFQPQPQPPRDGQQVVNDLEPRLPWNVVGGRNLDDGRESQRLRVAQREARLDQAIRRHVDRGEIGARCLLERGIRYERSRAVMISDAQSLLETQNAEF